MENTVLSLATRPRTLSSLFGQERMVAMIRKQMASRPPRSWMFTGPSGSGKTTTALIMAVSYQCEHMKLWGDPCADCWAAFSSFAIHEINASETSGVEELERVVGLSRMRPMSATGKRVIILDEAQLISKPAQNMLLKPTEQPPEHLIWIIGTTDPGKLLPTLQRRFTTYPLKLLSIDKVEEFLTKAAKRAGVVRPLPDLFEQCHIMQIGSPAILLQALEKYSAGSTAAEAAAGSSVAVIDTFTLCKAITGGDWSKARTCLKDATSDEARWIRASVAGWLRGILLRENNPRLQERAALSITELSQPPYDDAVMLHWMWGVLWKICNRYRSTQ